MKNEKAISLIALVITTLLIIVITIVITGFLYIRNNKTESQDEIKEDEKIEKEMPVEDKKAEKETPVEDEIPDNYIAVFNGGSGEITYSTYIYKIDNGHANYGFKYINVEYTTTSWGSPNWNYKITGQGEVDWTDGVFKVAKDNFAYSYVQIPNDKKAYTIEEFQKMFIMN